MKRITWILGEIADRMAPFLALMFLMFGIGMLGGAGDWLHRFWALCVLGLAGVAVWAFLD